MDANNIMTDIPLHVYEPEEEDYSVYIVLSKTQTLPSRVIKLWTREPYAHTSLAMDVELKEMYSFARKHLYNPFDCGFLGVMCQRSVERRYNYFCSQFVSYVLRKAGISLIMKKPGLTCPRDFRMCDDLEIIYEGKLRNYRNYLKLHFLRDAETGDYIVN